MKKRNLKIAGQLELVNPLSYLLMLKSLGATAKYFFRSFRSTARVNWWLVGVGDCPPPMVIVNQALQILIQIRNLKQTPSRDVPLAMLVLAKVFMFFRGKETKTEDWMPRMTIECDGTK